MRRVYRLKRRAAFNYVYRKGERTSARDVALICAKSREGVKIGLSVSKRVGNAVTRNRVKRLLREALTPLTERINPHYMYVLVAYPSIAGKGYGEVCALVERAFIKADKLK